MFQDVLKNVEALGLVGLGVGKVRHSFALPYPGRQLRLPLTSSRVSIFEFVLGCEIPHKGEVLTAMNHFWRMRFREKIPGFCDDLVASGSAMDEYLPAGLQGYPNLQKCAVIVEELEMIPREIITRKYLLGKAWKAYKQTGMVCGQTLPPGLEEGDRLPELLFTPTTKGEFDDEFVDIVEFEKEYGAEPAELAAKTYEVVDGILRPVGLMPADKKEEMGFLKLPDGSRKLALGDESGTPDCTRIWRIEDYSRRFPGSLPDPQDKQYLREYGISLGVDDRSKYHPKNPEDRERVKAIEIPQGIIDTTSDIYLEYIKTATGCTLAQYQREEMGIF